MTRAGSAPLTCLEMCVYERVLFARKNVCVCVYVYVCVCIYVCVCVCAYVCACLCFYLCMCVLVCASVCVSVCLRTCAWICACACVCMSVCAGATGRMRVCVCMYLGVHLWGAVQPGVLHAVPCALARIFRSKYHRTDFYTLSSICCAPSHRASIPFFSTPAVSSHSFFFDIITSAVTPNSARKN